MTTPEPVTINQVRAAVEQVHLWTDGTCALMRRIAERAERQRQEHRMPAAGRACWTCASPARDYPCPDATRAAETLADVLEWARQHGATA